MNENERMPDIPMKQRKMKQSVKHVRSRNAKKQTRDQRGKFAREPGFLQRAKMVIDGSASRRIAAQRAAETRRINRLYEQGQAVTPRRKARKPRSRKKKQEFQPRVSYYRQDVIAHLVGRLKFW